MPRLIQPAFSRGEIAPDLFGRVDTQAYQLALRTARNVFIHTYGGVSNRPGTTFIGPTKTHTKQARLLPFQFKNTDTHIIEVGDLYIRIIRNDAHVLESTKTVTGAIQADPVVITTSAAHGFSTGDHVFLASIGGMIEISGTCFSVTNLTATTFSLQSQVTGVDVDGTGFTAYTSGGTAARLFTLVTPYLEAELRAIKYSQTADVMTLVHPNHESRELKRLAVDNWTLTTITFAPTQAPPGVVTTKPRVTGTETAKYKVTATSEDGEESLPGIAAAPPLAISDITQANPGRVTTTLVHSLSNGDKVNINFVVGMTEVNDTTFTITVVDTTKFTIGVDTSGFTLYNSAGLVQLEGAAPGFSISAITNANPAEVTMVLAHGLDDGDEIEITGVVGMVELNNRRFRVNFVDTTKFTLRDIDSTSFATYTSGGVMKQAFHITPVSSTKFENDISWTVVTNASFYSVFREDNGLYGFVGETEALSFEDDSAKITVDLSITPPQERNPFFAAGNFPGAVGSHEQRRVFGGSNNKPDTSFYSKIGAVNNFTVAVPSRASDAITATLPSGEVNQIRHYTSLDELLEFTSGSEWLVLSGADVGFTAATLNQKFQSNWGTAQPRPIVVGATVLFLVDPGLSVRTLAFSNQRLGGFESNNLSLLIPHLLRNRSLVEWDHARKPESLIYVVRDDGELLVLSFEAEQQVIAWAHWDTAGSYESVAVIQPSIGDLIDAGYFIVKRTIDGNTVRLIERTHDREFEDVRDSFFVDSGLSFDTPVVIEDVDEADPVKITITGHSFVNGDEVDISDIIWVLDVDADFNETQPDQLNDGRFEVANAAANDFTLKSIDTGLDIDGSAFNAYVSGGNVRLAITAITGLFHLANTKVAILANGNVLPQQTVGATGALTLPRKFSRIHIGLPFISDVETLALEAPGTQTVQGVLKKIARTTIRFTRSRGLLIGPDTANLTEMKQREFENIGEPTNLLTGDKEIGLAPSWNVDGRIFMRQKDPLPMTILAVVPEVQFGDLG